MKKFAILFFVFVFGVLMNSCEIQGENGMANKDQQVVNAKFDKLLKNIQLCDKDATIALFSKTCVENTKSFDESVVELFEYFSGTLVSYDDWGGCYVETSREYNKTIKIIEATYDIKTTQRDYRLAFRYIAQDDTNTDNIGIESLYVIEAQRDTILDFAYWGDGNFNPGINIGIPNE